VGYGEDSCVVAVKKNRRRCKKREEEVPCREAKMRKELQEKSLGE